MAYDIEREPGVFAKGREASDRRVAFVFLLLVVAGVAVSAALVFTRTAAVVSALGLVFVAYAANHFFNVRLNSAVRWGKGGNAERAVGTRLEALRAEGFVVMHDLEHAVPGNVDHLVTGPTGAFMIETKFRRYQDADIPKAKRVAHTIARQLGARWVQPVICVATRDYGPRMVRGVAVVGGEQLLPYIRSQRNPPVDFDGLGGFADRQ